MVKPNGNLTANLPPSDKVSHRTKARFGSPADYPTLAGGGKPSTPAKKVRKFKTRKH